MLRKSVVKMMARAGDRDQEQAYIVLLFGA
jgi:hypothetical protein